jgi:hypothetical protein
VRQGRVVYVGQTKNVFWRIAQHHVNQKRRKRLTYTQEFSNSGQHARIAFDEVLVKWCEKRELDHHEIEMISKYKPEGNVQRRNAAFPKVKVDLAQIIAKAGLEGWKKSLSESSQRYEPLRRRPL